MAKSKKSSSKQKQNKPAPAKKPEPTPAPDVSKQHAAPEPAATKVPAPSAGQRIYRMELVAGRADQATRDQIAAMWIKAGVLPPEEAARRSNESVIIVRKEGGEVVGASSAHPVQVVNFGVCWSLRMFLLPQQRGFLGKNGKGLSAWMLNATMDFLSRWSASIPQNPPVGVVMVLDNKKLHTPRWKRALESQGWHYAGTVPNGSPALLRPFVRRALQNTGGAPS